MAEIIQRELFGENGEVIGYEYGGRLVRCGECMRRDKVTGWCDDVQDYISNTNWFCAGGERKDGDVDG